MDIKTLESFKLSDAIKFHDELNPRLWKDDHLDPLVKKQLLVIAEDFIEELGIRDLDVEDITVSGSNAAYSYTPHSDLDLHIIVDMSKLPNDKVYRELFDAKKVIYNQSHDITVHGVPVELYVQDSQQPVVSLGEYSILNDKWIKIPKKQRANFDQTATKEKFEQLARIIKVAVKSKDGEKINKAIKKIKQYRKAGLDKYGEFGPENLAYKALRTQGLIDALYDARDKAHSEKLSIEEESKLLDKPTPTVDELAKKYKVDRMEVAKQLDKGIKVELEHTKKYTVAREIALDHLGENLKYYEKLAKAELEEDRFSNGCVVYPKKKLLPEQMATFPKLLTFDEYVDTKSRAWQRYSNQVRAYFYDRGLSSDVATTALNESLKRIKQKRLLGEGIEFEKNSTKPIDPILKFIEDESIDRQKLKIGQQVDVLRVNTINFAKYLSLDFYNDLTIVDLSEPNSIVAKDRSGKTISLNTDKMNDQTLETGTHIIPKDSRKLKTGIMFYEDRVKNEGWTIDVYNVNTKSDLEEGAVKNKLFVRQLSTENELIEHAKLFAKNLSLEGVPVTSKNRHTVVCSTIFAHNKKSLNESKHITSGKEAVQLLNRLDQFSKLPIKVGTKVAIINSQLQGDSLELWGFTTPKKISKIYRDPSDKSIKQFEFNNDPNDVWPRTENAEYNGHFLMYSAFFGDKKSADQALTMLMIQSSGDLEIRNHIVNEGASGYIPSNAEKNDPRYKTALTVDVKPNTMKRDAAKFGNKITRAGIPPQARSDGKIK